MGEGFALSMSFHPSPIHRNPFIEMPSPARGEGIFGLDSPRRFSARIVRNPQPISDKPETAGAHLRVTERGRGL
jgi:hypothetical protein